MKDPNRRSRRSRARWKARLDDVALRILRRRRLTMTVTALVATSVAGMLLVTATSKSGASSVLDAFDGATTGSAALLVLDPDVRPTESLEQLEDRVIASSGVIAAGALAQGTRTLLLANPQRPDRTAATTDVQLFAITTSLLSAAEVSLTHTERSETQGWLLGPNVRAVYIGAAYLPVLGSKVDDPPQSVRINGLTFLVAGIIEKSPLLPELVAGVVTGEDAAKLLGLDTPLRRVVLRLSPASDTLDAAQKAIPTLGTTEQIGIELRPTPQQLRGDLSGRLVDVVDWLTALTVVLTFLVIAIVVVLSTMAASKEIALSRALGATRTDAALSVALEMMILGALGGLIGAALVSIGLSVSSHFLSSPGDVGWTTFATAPIIGSVASLVAALPATYLASRVEPWKMLAAA